MCNKMTENIVFKSGQQFSALMHNCLYSNYFFLDTKLNTESNGST